jgi:hypothetical protein
LPDVQIVWYGRLMPFDSLTDYLVAAAWLTPLWVGAFAFGYRLAERWGWREVNANAESLRQLHEDHLDNIDAAYGIDSRSVPARIRVHFPETEH